MILLAQDYVQKAASRSARFLSWFEDLAVPTPLKAGDANFYTYGNQLVTAEVKRPLDICICFRQTGRLVQQFRNALAEGCVAYVVVVQEMQRTEDGLVGTIGWNPVKKKREVMAVQLPGGETVRYRDLDNFLNTLHYLEGVQIKRTGNDRETAQVITDLFHWWQKAPEDHQSTARFYTPIHLPLAQTSLVRRVAKELPGIGMDRSKAVEERFPSVVEMALAGEREWREIDGVGKVLAKRIVSAIREGSTE